LGHINALQVVAGTDYLISAGTAFWGAGSFDLSCIAQPNQGVPNDVCTSAIALTNGLYSFDSTYALSRQIAGNGAPYHDLWYAYKPPCAGKVQVALRAACNANTNRPMLMLGERDLTTTDCNTMKNVNYWYYYTGTQEVAVTPDKTYVIRVGAQSAGQFGAGTIEIASICPVPIGTARNLVPGLSFILVAILAFVAI
jgi:hypothetical protein